MKEKINIDSVVLRFGEVDVLNGIYFEFEPQQITGILGRNGCGKSCLLKIIMGQLKPQQKHIQYKGKHLEHLYKEKGLINYLPQHEFHPRPARLKQLLAYYGIPVHPFLQRYPFFSNKISHKFSSFAGGERRLIEVLLVLESPSEFSILDEPFSHIMPIHIDLVKDRIQELAQRKGILITDHQYRNVLDLSDHLYLMKHGRITPISCEEDLRTFGYI